MSINRIAILGVGLIGGSLARVLRREEFCKNIIGYGRHEENLKKAIELGVIDQYELAPALAVKDADVVVLATPLATNESLFVKIRDSLKADAVITDVGSAKGNIIDAARKVLTNGQLVKFVPGHPIAGTEKNGVEASFPELFADRLVILTPLNESDKASINLISRMWECTGAQVVIMDSSHHDEVLAATSHLPHVLAYALVDCLAGMHERDEIFQFAAGGFADFTRIASSNPEMWHDICLANRENLIRMLERFDEHLVDIREAIVQGDSDGLLDIFTRAKNARDKFDTT